MAKMTDTERDEFLYHEMLAHVPLHSHRAPRRVLIVGGGDGGTLREALKHPTIENVILVELDPQVVETCQRFFPRLAAGFTSPGVTVHHTDGVRYLEETNDRFDVILANPPFGGKERKKKVQQNFAVKTGETVFLFLKHFIKILKPGDPVESSSESPLSITLLTILNRHKPLSSRARVALPR